MDPVVVVPHRGEYAGPESSTGRSTLLHNNNINSNSNNSPCLFPPTPSAASGRIAYASTSTNASTSSSCGTSSTSRPVTDSSEDERASASSNSGVRSLTEEDTVRIATTVTNTRKHGGTQDKLDSRQVEVDGPINVDKNGTISSTSSPPHQRLLLLDPDIMMDNGAEDHLADHADESRDEETRRRKGPSRSSSTTSTSSSPLHQEHIDRFNERENTELESTLMLIRNKRIMLSRLQEMVPRGMLALINLSRRGLSAADALLLVEAIRTNPHLTVLKLSYNHLGDTGALMLATALSSNKRLAGQQHQSCHHHNKLAMLDLGFNGIGDTGCEGLALHALAGNYTLQALYLSGNQITTKGALSIAGAILHGTGLNRLHLSANHIESTGLTALAGAIAATDHRMTDPDSCKISLYRPIRELHFGNCGIQLDGLVSLSQMMLTNSSLTSLCLTGNNLNDTDMILLSQALTQNKYLPLELLELSFNNITCPGVECLMNAVWGSSTLRTLKLDNNRIKDRGAQLCAVMLTSVALQVLDLSFNCITTVGIKALMKNLSENNSLLSLGLSGIALDLNSSKAVSYALAYNSSLKALYLDSCTAGYASQRHIVAGVISNQMSSLRTITGFPLGPIAMTLGVPRLPDEWSNDQVLGFFRHMWQQWLLKSRRGRTDGHEELPRGPAPPAAVASAAKIALTSLGSPSGYLFVSEKHEKPISDQTPVDSAYAAFLERSESGTVRAPSFADLMDDVLDNVVANNEKPNPVASPPGSAIVRTAFDNPERRSKNLQWLRIHVRSLNDVGRLPFNNADLWQLQQYYLSPPINTREIDDNNSNNHESPTVVQAVSPNVMESNSSPLGRTVSFQSLGLAVAALGTMPSNSQKRRPDVDNNSLERPLPKRSKNLKPRIAFYPRIMSKIQSLVSKPMDLTLSLLRQLKFTENVVFGNTNPYFDSEDKLRDDHLSHSDIEMVLLDLL